MMQTLVSMAIVLTVGLPFAVSQAKVPPPPTMRLSRGCVYAYKPPLKLNLPKEPASESETVLSLSPPLSFQEILASDFPVVAVQHEKESAIGRFWPPLLVREDTSPWVILCGLHGFNHGENTK